MSDRAVILGAGRQALVMAGYLEEVSLEPAAFIEEVAPDYDRDVSVYSAPIYSFDDDELASLHDLPAITAVGSPALRQRLVGRWQRAHFLTFVSEAAWVAGNAAVGNGSSVGPLASIDNAARIGDHVLVSQSAVLSHDVVVSDFATISPACAIAGNVAIGSGAFLGIGSTVIERVRIGEAAFVAAGSVVVENVGDGQTVMGVPARPVSGPH